MDSPEAAYADAHDYLNAVRRAVGSLRSATDAMDELAGYDGLGAIAAGGGHIGSRDPDARMVAAVTRVDSARDALKASAERYAALICSLEQSIERMERAGDAAEGDSAVLRYRFAQALSYRDVADMAGYSREYIRNKVVLATVHIAAHVPRNWRNL